MITIVIITFLVIINISLVLWVVSFVNRLEAESSVIKRLSKMVETIRVGLNDIATKTYERKRDVDKELICLRRDIISLKDSMSDNILLSFKRDKFISDGVDALANYLKLEIRPFHIKEEKKGFKIVKLKK